MRRIAIIVVLGVIVLAAAGYLFFVRLRPQGGAPAGAGGNEANGGAAGGASADADAIAPLSPADIPAGNVIAIGTPQGTVTVSNFYRTAAGADGEAIVLRKTATYEIIYDAAVSAFGIYVFAPPVAANEAAAEQDILSDLSVSQADACKLDITWSAADTGGRSYPPSFCPQGAQ